jgi:hypothetical protein
MGMKNIYTDAHSLLPFVVCLIVYFEPTHGFTLKVKDLTIPT